MMMRSRISFDQRGLQSPFNVRVGPSEGEMFAITILTLLVIVQL